MGPQPLCVSWQQAVSDEAKSLRGRVRRSGLVVTVFVQDLLFSRRGWAWTEACAGRQLRQRTRPLMSPAYWRIAWPRTAGVAEWPFDCGRA